MKSSVRNHHKYSLTGLSLAFLAVFILLDPSIANAQGGLVTCDGVDVDCDWDALIAMINGLIYWLITIATSVAVLLFMYAGFLYMTSRGNESQVKQATTIFTNVAIGFAIMLIAWLLVATIVSLLTGEEISTFI